MSKRDDRRAQQLVEEDVLRRVLASFDQTPDLRVRNVIQALVRHLHSFLREVRLTQAEWEQAIAFLTRAGQITDDRRQEFILLSDVLGASMQTVAIGNEMRGNATEATVFGPFFVEGSPHIELGGDISFGLSGEPAWIEGRVTGIDGEPIPGARIEVWEAGDEELYDVQYEDGRRGGRAHLFADCDGRYRFWGLTPTPYPIPYDGPVGDLLRLTNRSPYRAPHLHFMVTANGYRRLVTHIFVRGGEYLDSDSVFGVKDSLIKDFVRQPAGTRGPDGRDLGGETWTHAVFDIVLASAKPESNSDARNA